MNYPIDISDTVLKTKRTILRPWKLSDLDDFFEYASIYGVGENAGWLPHKNKEESKGILENFIKDKKARELGFVLSKTYWGQGIMPEVVNRVCEYLFNDIGLDVIVCGYYEGNNQSKRVQEKCGFNYLKTYDRTNKYGITRKCVVNIKEKD